MNSRSVFAFAVAMAVMLAGASIGHRVAGVSAQETAAEEDKSAAENKAFAPYPPAPVWHNTIKVTSEAFMQGQQIPVEYTSFGANVSPALAWSGVPTEAKEIVVMLEDPDGTGGNFSHWLLYGLPPDVTNLPKGVPTNTEINTPPAKQGMNSLLKVGYFGPGPVAGSGVHHYTFRVFALDKKLDVPPGAMKEDVQAQMYKHVLAQGVLMGTYEKKKEE